MASFTKAQRSGVSCIVGIAGTTGSGKTLTMLRIARGLAADPGDDLTDPETLARVDARIAVLDTEAGRAKHYAPPAGELPSEFLFGFSHADLKAPFTPEAYKALIEEADAAGFRVIACDSFSHEWEGEGGVTAIHDEILDKIVERDRAKNGSSHWWNEDNVREKFSLGAWKAPKLRHKRLVSRLLQCRAHIVICMRAEDKMRIETSKEQKRDGGEYTKTTIVAPKDMPLKDRWQPICEKRFPYELITSIVLTPDAPGVPVPLKLQEQHKAFFPEGKQITERAGQGLAAWARGATPPTRSTLPSQAKREALNETSKTPTSGGPGSGQRITGGAGGAGAQPSASISNEPVAYVGLTFSPSNPDRVTPPCPLEDMNGGELTEYATALADLIKRAPDHAKAAWYERNAPELLRLKALKPGLAARLHDLAFAGGSTHPPAKEDAPGGPDRGAGASSTASGVML